MKRTEIKHVEIGEGEVKILEIKNVAGATEIADQYGPKVAKIYIGGIPMYCPMSLTMPGIRLNTKHATYQVYAGSTLPAEDFERFVSSLRDAGKRLLEIVKANPGNEVKTTII